MKKCPLCIIVQLLAAVGAMNWGLVTFMNKNLVTMLLGEGTVLSRIVYALVAVSGVMMLVCLVKSCPCTGKSCAK